MRSSSNHHIVPLPESEIRWLRERQAEDAARYDVTWKPIHLCKHQDCTEIATHAARFSYVTGRRGRVSYRDRRMCERHAQEWLARQQATAAAEAER